MGVLDNIRNEAKKASSNKSKLMFFKDGTKTRVRFLTDMEDGLEIKFHDSFAKSINTPCREVFDEECPYCDDEELRTRNKYVFCVYDYESESVKLICEPVNSFSPIPQLVAFYDSYGTITDRDYVIQQTGKGQNKSFAIIPQDKKAFRVPKVKPYSEQKILQILAKAYPADEETEETSKRKPKANSKPKKQDEWEDDEEESANEYEDMTAQELYKLCKERDIDCKPRKEKQFYINLLQEDDEAEEEWNDEEEEDE